MRVYAGLRNVIKMYQLKKHKQSIKRIAIGFGICRRGMWKKNIIV